MPTVSVSNESMTMQVKLENSEGCRDLFELVKHLQELVKPVLEKLLKEMQRETLKHQLGPRYRSGNRFNNKRCPECESRAANRKTFRTRPVPVPKLGEVDVPKAYVSCRDCGRSWGPYDEELGLPENRQYGPEALLEPLKEAIRTTYRKASNLFDWAPSPMTLWRRLTENPPETESVQGDETVLVDATRVPSRGDQTQWSLSVAHGFTSEGGAESRTVVASVSGKEKDIKPELNGEGIDTLVHDGNLEFGPIARRPARCWWHLPRQLRVLMHQQGTTDPTNRRLTRSFKRCLYALGFDEEKARRYLTKWAEVVRPLSETAAQYVRGARDGIVQYLKAPGAFATHSTSWVEREMVELNKRFENGAVWSQHGSGAMLAHHQMLRHHPNTWEQQMNQKLGNTVPDT